MNIVTLTIFGATALFLGLLFARKTASRYIEWIKADRPRDKFTNRVVGLFYDWGASRLKSDEALNKPANVFLLMVVETMIAVVLFSLPFILHKCVVLFIVAVIILGCAYFTGKISRINPGEEKIAVAFILPLQIYAAIRLFVSLLIFIVIAIYDFFKSAVAKSSTSSTRPSEQQSLPPAEIQKSKKESDS